MITTIISNDMQASSAAPCVATIGFFDGVHLGHHFLIKQVVEEARMLGAESAVVTFGSHPRQVLNADYQPQLLSTPEEKQAMLGRTGVERCYILPFDRQLAAMTAKEFMERILKERIGVCRLVVGYDHRFGHNREEGFADYVRYGKEMGIDVVRADAFVLNGVNVSSSVIRSLLKEGEVAMAAKCLGYHYWLSGKVIDGVKEGRRMGFPTANISLDDIQKLVPANGVYAVVAALCDDQGVCHKYKAMMNIGCRPTFSGTSTTMEVFLLGFSGNLYGKELRVAFVKRLRQERKFSSEAELARQLQKDRDEVAALDMKL